MHAAPLCIGFAAGLCAGWWVAVAPERAAADPPDPSAAPLYGAYSATSLRVIDGDTVEARVAVWPGHEVSTRLRLRGIDAPELNGACAAEVLRAQAARDRLGALLAGGSAIVGRIGPDRYFGRVVASIVLPDGRDAGAVLMAEGHARPYRGGRRAGWCGPAS